MEIMLGIILIIAVLYVIGYGVLFFIGGMAYGYWGLSIVMAPILWLLMIIGAVVGFIHAIKNAIKAIQAVKRGA